MDMNVYLVEWWAKERLGEIRAAVVREQLAESLRRRPRFRVALGRALINFGRKLQGNRTAVGDPAAGTSVAS
jgi:hypothetical protein